MWRGQLTTPLARVKWRPFFPGAPDPLAPLPAQRQSGALLPAAGVRHISHRRFMATFPLVAVSREDQDLYRCVSQAPRGAGVSNFAELIVKGERAVGLRGAGRAKVEWAGLLPGGGVSSMGRGPWTRRKGRVRLRVCSDLPGGARGGGVISWEIGS